MAQVFAKTTTYNQTNSMLHQLQHIAYTTSLSSQLSVPPAQVRGHMHTYQASVFTPTESGSRLAKRDNSISQFVCHVIEACDETETCTGINQSSNAICRSVNLCSLEIYLLCTQTSSLNFEDAHSRKTHIAH